MANSKKSQSASKGVLEKIYGPAFGGEQYLPIPTKIFRLLTKKLGLSTNERVVVLEILSYKRSADDPYPSMALIADGTGLHISTVERIIKRLGWNGEAEESTAGKLFQIIHRSQNGKRTSNAYGFGLLVEAL